MSFAPLRMTVSLLALRSRGTKSRGYIGFCIRLQPKNLSARNTVLGLNFRVNVVLGVDT
jgi:hypothetical protein